MTRAGSAKVSGLLLLELALQLWTYRHHGWCVVWVGRADLARAEGRTRRERAGSKMRTGSQGWGHIAQRLAADGTKLGADYIGAKPAATLLTPRIDTLNCGARH